MTHLVLNTSSTAQWHDLVQDAQQITNNKLSEMLESYLVFLLMRFINKPEIASTILALDYLNSLLETKQKRREQLRDIGDQCLLFSGLFPQRAERKRVKISYFVYLGQNAYSELAHADRIYNDLSHRFVELMDTLYAIRQIGGNHPELSPFQAYDLWLDTGSKMCAKTVTQKNNKNIALLREDNKQH